MKYIDTNIFVNASMGDKKAMHFLFSVIEGDVDASTSSLAWDEYVWAMRKLIGKKDAMELSFNFLSFPNLKFLDITHDICFVAHNFVDKYNLKPRDAMHAACAFKNGMKEIISEDSDFDKIKILKRIKP